MPAGTLEALSTAVKADPLCKLDPAIYDFYVANDVQALAQNCAIVDNGQCVELVKQKAGAPVTSFWRKGPRVKGNSAIPAGAAIATGWNESDL